jgi:hypothetical protein
VLLYVQMLRDLRPNRVAASDIAVISPYRKQVQRIRTLLAKDHGAVLVSSPGCWLSCSASIYKMCNLCVSSCSMS